MQLAYDKLNKEDTTVTVTNKDGSTSTQTIPAITITAVSKDAAGNVSTEVSTDVTMRKYNVTFYDGDRSTVLQDGQYVYGQEVVAPVNPTSYIDGHILRITAISSTILRCYR